MQKLVAQKEKLRIFRWKGIAADMPHVVRMLVLVAIVIAVVAISLTHLGMMKLEFASNTNLVFLRFLIIPVGVTALLYGTRAGTLVGLFAGVVSYAHARFFPADYYENFLVMPLNSIVLLTCVGFVLSILLSFACQKISKRGLRFLAYAIIALVCAALHDLLFFALFTVDLISYLSLFSNVDQFIDFFVNNTYLSIAIETLVLFAVLAVADLVVHAMLDRASERKLRRVFQGWLLLVVLNVFMVIGTAQFVGVSVTMLNNAQQSMQSELDYLCRQISDHSGDPVMLLDGYTVEQDGYVVILTKQTVIASDDPETPAGMSILEYMGVSDIDMSPEDVNQSIDYYFGNLSSSGELQQGDMKFNDGHTEVSYALAQNIGDYWVLITYPQSKVFAERPVTMAWTTIAIASVLLAVFLLATFLLNRVVVRRIDETNETLARITDGDLNARVNIRDILEFSSLSTGVNTTVRALKDAILEAEQRNAQELMTAKAIQESALPREFPPFPDIDKFDIYASMKTAKEVGGDFYDFFLIDEGKLGFIIADVSGKGVPAALFMMTTKTQIQNYMEAGLSVSEAVQAANHQLNIGNDEGMFVTMFACLLNYDTGELRYVNAGHNPPLILHDGKWEWLRDVSGMPLGLFDGLPYEEFTCKLEKEDLFYLYTDGVTEAMNVDGELFGEDRLEDCLYRYADMNPRSVGVGVRRAITDFTLDAEQSDDITMLCLKYGVAPEKRAVMVLPAIDTQLIHVNNFVHEELRRRNAPRSVYNPLDIAAEELFVNVCHYAYPDATEEEPGEVRISFVYEANPPSLTVSIEDDGVEYNPLAKPDAVTPDDIADVPIGGLGILMAKRSVDEMTYKRENGSNILTFRKGW